MIGNGSFSPNTSVNNHTEDDRNNLEATVEKINPDCTAEDPQVIPDTAADEIVPYIIREQSYEEMRKLQANNDQKWEMVAKHLRAHERALYRQIPSDDESELPALKPKPQPKPPVPAAKLPQQPQPQPKSQPFASHPANPQWSASQQLNPCTDGNFQPDNYMVFQSVFDVHDALGTCDQPSTCLWFLRNRSLFRHYRITPSTEAPLIRRMQHHLRYISHLIEELHIVYSGGERSSTAYTDLTEYLERLSWPRLHTMHISHCRTEFGFRLPALRGLQRLHMSKCSWKPDWNQLIEVNASSLWQLSFRCVYNMRDVNFNAPDLQELHLLQCDRLSVSTLYNARLGKSKELPVLYLQCCDFDEVGRRYSAETVQYMLESIFKRIERHSILARVTDLIPDFAEY